MMKDVIKKLAIILFVCALLPCSLLVAEKKGKSVEAPEEESAPVQQGRIIVLVVDISQSIKGQLDDIIDGLCEEIVEKRLQSGDYCVIVPLGDASNSDKADSFGVKFSNDKEKIKNYLHQIKSWMPTNLNTDIGAAMKKAFFYINMINEENNGDMYEPLVLFYDKKARKYIDVDLMILERGASGERQLLQESNFKGGKVKFIPGFGYTLYAKRDGYFSVYREFNSRELMLHDTVMLYQMERTERGSSFQIKELYYESGEATLIGNYDSVLMDYVAMFRNHPEVTFLVKGYVQSYGVDAEADMLLSLERAKSVKDYFVKQGIAENRITTAGMTRNEIKRAAAAALNSGGGFSSVKAEIIITGKLGEEQ